MILHHPTEGINKMSDAMTDQAPPLADEPMMSHTDHIRAHTTDADILFWCDEIDALIADQAEALERCREALKLINGQTQDFTHGDTLAELFVRGLGKHASRALSDA